jgi:hypothetical protein
MLPACTRMHTHPRARDKYAHTIVHGIECPPALMLCFSTVGLRLTVRQQIVIVFVHMAFREFDWGQVIPIVWAGSVRVGGVGVTAAARRQYDGPTSHQVVHPRPLVVVLPAVLGQDC